MDVDRIQIVRWLRSGATLLESRNFTEIPVTMRDAANVIEQQQAEIERLTKAKKKGKK